MQPAKHKSAQTYTYMPLEVQQHSSWKVVGVKVLMAAKVMKRQLVSKEFEAIVEARMANWLEGFAKRSQGRGYSEPTSTVKDQPSNAQACS